MDIYTMNLHDNIHEGKGNIDITRVPGGWLYYYVFRKATMFVAYNDDLNIAKHEADQQAMYDATMDRLKFSAMQRKTL